MVKVDGFQWQSSPKMWFVEQIDGYMNGGCSFGQRVVDRKAKNS